MIHNSIFIALDNTVIRVPEPEFLLNIVLASQICLMGYR